MRGPSREPGAALGSCRRQAQAGGRLATGRLGRQAPRAEGHTVSKTPFLTRAWKPGPLPCARRRTQTGADEAPRRRQDRPPGF